jgi:signal transduction histidine kinase
MKKGRWGLTGITERVTKMGGAATIENNFENNVGVRITILL